MKAIDTFQNADLSPESYWRSVVLFGRNVASYKFALAKSLLELAQQGRDSVTLAELAVPYSAHLCEHLRHSPKQVTSRSSKFLDACKDYNNGLVSQESLLLTTESLGFNNVIDAFHVVNRGEIPTRFYEKDYGRGKKRIVLTDEVFGLAESEFAGSMFQEVESRWNLVETAWEMGVSTNLLRVDYETDSGLLVADNRLRRKSVTSSRGALNGYQKGKCFYCFTGINAADGGEAAAEQEPERPKLNIVSVPPEEQVHYEFVELDAAPALPVPKAEPEPLCDVDHYFPHVLKNCIPNVNFDGVWNLVLACPDCNRGEDGKFARVPELKYLERLHRRNEYLIGSHHPLRETIIAQTGADEPTRRQYLYHIDQKAIEILAHRWSVEPRAEATF